MKKYFFYICFFVLLFLNGCSSKNSSEEQEEIKSFDEVVSGLQNGKYEKLKFSNCHFEDIPDVDEIFMLKTKGNVVTALETKEYFEKAVKAAGLETSYSFENQVLDCKHFDSGIEDGKPYMKAADTMKAGEEIGTGFSLEHPSLCMLMGSSGIQQYGNDKASIYLKSISEGRMSPFLSSVGGIEEYASVVKEYYGEELNSTDNYETFSGNISIKAVKELTENYFASKADPLSPTEDVKEIVDMVTVLKFGEGNDAKYGFKVCNRRKYREFDILNSYVRGFSSGGNYVIDDDYKEAYVLDEKGVCAFAGFNLSEKFEQDGEAVSRDKLYTLGQAVKIITDKFGEGASFSFRVVKPVYTRIVDMDKAGEVIKNYRLYWLFEGTNLVDARTIDIFIDAVNGEFFYRSY